MINVCQSVELLPKTLIGLFRHLDARQVRYAVLRNYKKLPYELDSGDLDLVVHPNDLYNAIESVKSVAIEMGLSIARYFHDDTFKSFVISGRDAALNLFSVQIDLMPGRTVYGVELLSGEEMVRSIQRHNGIPVVEDQYILLDKWLYHLAVGVRVRPRYDDEFRRIIDSSFEKVNSKIIEIFGHKKSKEIIERFYADKLSSSPPLSYMSRAIFLLKIINNRGAVGYRRFLSFLYYKILNTSFPKGIFISLSGPDGSGKTTVIELVLKQLHQLYRADNVDYFHFRPTILPRIAEVAKAARAVDKVDVDYARPHRSTPSGLFGSLVRLAWYGLDYFCGYFRMIRPALVDRKVVLFDRYYYDMICDPGRSRVRLPAAILRAAGYLLPLPAFPFFVRVAPEVAHARKQELTEEQIRTLNLRYDDLVRRGWLIAVDNDGPPEQAAAAIVDHIIARKDKAARQALLMAQE